MQAIAIGPIAAQLLPAGMVRNVTLARTVALTLEAAGVFGAAAGTWRYFTVAADVESGRYRIASSTILVTLVSAAVSIAVILSLRR